MSDFTLSATITGDATSLRKALLDSASSVKLFGKEVDDVSGKVATKFGTETRRSIKEVEQATEDLANRGGRNMSAFGSLLGKYAGGAALAGLAVQIGKTGVGFHDFVSKNELAFETMLGSAEAAKSYMAEILAFAKQTPFAFPELTASAQKMVAFGVDSTKVIGILETLGDAAVGAGGGITEVEGLSTVIGQIQAKGRLQNEEILQLAERGLPALRVLANQANMTTAEYQKLVSTGAVSADEAIESLISGLRDGTTGINEATSAYGGLMAKMKESGNFSSTWDSFQSSFRNMSAAITQDLLPVIIELINSGADLMKVVQKVAEFISGLPAPLKTATVAFIALTIAQNKFGQGATTGAVAGIGKMIVSLRSMYLEQVKNAGGIVFSGQGSRAAQNFGSVTATAGQKAKAGFAVMATGAKSAGNAIMGAFGGPVGIAVTGSLAILTAGITNYSKAMNEAKSFVESYSDALEEAGGKTTEVTAKILEEQSKIERRKWTEWWGGSTMLEDADKLGISLAQIEDAVADGPERLHELADSIKEMDAAQAKAGGGLNKGSARLVEDLNNWAKQLEKQAKLEEIVEKQEVQRPKTIYELAEAYRSAQWALNGFNEETEKAIDKYAQGFGDAFAGAFSTVSGFKATIITAEQYASAQEKVASANKKVSEAQSAQNRLGDLRTTSKQRADAAKSVTEALNGQREAYKDLNALAAQDRPIGTQMKEYFTQTLKDAESFSKDIETLISKGLDPKLIEDLIKKGPESAASEMKAYLSTNGEALISLANQTEETLQGMNQRVVENARLAAIAMNSQVSTVAEDLPLAMKIAATRGSNESMTDEELAGLLGVTSDDVKRVAATFGQAWVITAEEEIARNNVFLQTPWQVKEEDSASAFLQAQSDGATIRPNIMIDPEYGIVTTPEEYLRSRGAEKNPSNYAPWRMNENSFNTGGIMPGYSPGVDVHRFYSPTAGFLNLSGGEPFMRPEFGVAVGHDWIHRMNHIARTGGVGAVRNAMYRDLGTQSFNSGGIFGTAPSVVEVPVTSRVENHGTTIIEKVIANDPLEFKREMALKNRRRNTFG